MISQYCISLRMNNQIAAEGENTLCISCLYPIEIETLNAAMR